MTVKQQISLFRTIESIDLVMETGYSESAIEASFFSGNTEIQLDVEAEGNAVIISDSNLDWDLSKHGLALRKTISLKNVGLFFGENGVAQDGAVLGIAAIVSSLTSNRTEVFRIVEFDSKSHPIKKECEIILPKGIFRGHLYLRTALYLVRSTNKKTGYACSSGTIIGTLGKTTIETTDRLLFPIVEVDEPKEPIWWVRCNWTDATEDIFEESNVCIFLNRGHKNFNLIDTDSEKKCTPYLADIVCTAIQMMIEKAMHNTEEWKKIQTIPNHLEGSVAYVLNYIISLGWDFSTPELLAKSIRNYVYPRMV